jgi:hypothetical protein
MLIITLQRDKKYQFKSTFYLFLIYNGILYSIDNSDQRLNINNTEGLRNPGRYIDRKYDKIWLPLNLIEEDLEISTQKDLILRNSSIKKIISLEKISEEQPEIICWLYIFLDKTIQYINTNDIDQGITKNDIVKSIEYINSNPVDLVLQSDGPGKYLENIYLTKCTDIVVKEDQLPKVVGTENYIKQVIAYSRRQLFADNIKNLVLKDYTKNHKKVYQKITDFVKNYPLNILIEKALKNEKYSCMIYPSFASDVEEEGLIKKEILSMVTSSYYIYSSLDIYLGDTFDKFNGVCIYDKKTKWKKLVVLSFIDYRQFFEFFEIIEENIIPHQMKDHLHQQSTWYVGNSILNDLDPIDMIYDPWFKRENNRNDHPKINVIIPICNKCIKKLQRVKNES